MDAEGDGWVQFVPLSNMGIHGWGIMQHKETMLSRIMIVRYIPVLSATIPQNGMPSVSPISLVPVTNPALLGLSPMLTMKTFNSGI